MADVFDKSERSVIMSKVRSKGNKTTELRLIEMSEIFGMNGYNLYLMDDYKEYIKRLIIIIDKPIGRDLYNCKYENLQEQLNPEIYELAPSTKLGHSLCE